MEAKRVLSDPDCRHAYNSRLTKQRKCKSSMKHSTISEELTNLGLYKCLDDILQIMQKDGPQRLPEVRVKKFNINREWLEITGFILSHTSQFL